MIINCHVHTDAYEDPEAVSKEELLKQLDICGVDQIFLLSARPNSFIKEDSNAVKGSGTFCGKPLSPAQALANVMSWAAFSERIVPFFWVDPLDEDAFEQVDRAVAAGIKGFKVICNRHYPGDDRPMQVWERIAKAGRPILFHSGILYGNGPWSKYCRPIEFEPLIEVPHLRFALAHVSWPWCDEHLAVFGHLNSRRARCTSSAEMFIDTTPGTPANVRREVFKKIYTTFSDKAVENNIIFGTDGSYSYNAERTKSILAMDNDALDFAEATAEQKDKFFSKNALRFLHGDQ